MSVAALQAIDPLEARIRTLEERLMRLEGRGGRIQPANDIDMRGHRIINLGAPLRDRDATHKSAAGVASLNGLTGAVTLSAGSNVTLTPSGHDIQIASSGGGGSGDELFAWFYGG